PRWGTRGGRALSGSDTHAVVRTFNGAHADRAGRRDVRVGREFFKKVIDELLASPVFVVTVGITEREHETVRSLEAAAFVQQTLEAAQNQSGAHEEKKSEGDLGRYQHRAEPALTPAGACLTFPFTESSGDSLYRRLERRRQAAKQTGEQSD